VGDSAVAVLGCDGDGFADIGGGAVGAEDGGFGRGRRSVSAGFACLGWCFGGGGGWVAGFAGRGAEGVDSAELFHG